MNRRAYLDTAQAVERGMREGGGLAAQVRGVVREGRESILMSRLSDDKVAVREMMCDPVEECVTMMAALGAPTPGAAGAKREDTSTSPVCSTTTFDVGRVPELDRLNAGGLLTFSPVLLLLCHVHLCVSCSWLFRVRVFLLSTSLYRRFCEDSSAEPQRPELRWETIPFRRGSRFGSRLVTDGYC